ncbi:Protein CBG24645 [Caenorhabditis briggsae]|uniref:Protein CBG24645 n=1 Tax=Caenorhabditis briggsae TaxID=6238 RepID=A8WL62_CAEBR|nr:Protein CBG24645 [Caenorhabditis briggsae]CAP21207.2 Protein CBG24645 [Caenorhabditis briggsae]
MRNYRFFIVVTVVFLFVYLLNSQNYTQLSLIGAYVYPTYISITINSQSMVKQPVYCRYYDCQRNELLGSHWKSTVFPESVVHCPRRIGAEFVSISREMDDRAPTPMRLKFRIFDSLSARKLEFVGSRLKSIFWRFFNILDLSMLTSSKRCTILLRKFPDMALLLSF